MISTSILRQLWTIIEDTQAIILLSLPESDLVNQLLSLVQQREVLSKQQYEAVKDYLHERTPLIRDLASSRL